MTDLNLVDIKNNIEKYTALIAFIIKADIEIVDKNINIISKQVKFDNIDDRSCSSVVYSEVFKSKSSVILDNPRRNKLCQDCEDRNRCLKKMEIAYPIMENSNVIGAIGIVCYNLGQKENFVKEFDTLSSFINTIISLLEVNLIDYINLKELKSISELLKSSVDILDKAYIIFDGDNNILDYNASAKSYVSEDINSISIVEIANNTLIKKIKINDKILNISGSELKYYNSNFDTVQILVFTEIEDYLQKYSFNQYSNSEDAQNFIGVSEVSERLNAKISALSKTNSIVLISGESGSGKEHSAKMICYQSKKYNNRFVKIDCKNSSAESLENKIFGYPSKNKEEGFYFPGKLQSANNGVLYIENVEYMPVYIMNYILNAHNNKNVHIRGYDLYSKIDFKLICSTNDLTDNILDRLKLSGFTSFMPLYIPSLREREGDLILLFDYFIKKFSENYSLLPDYSDIIGALENYSFPDNIKELEFIADLICSTFKKDEKTDIEYIKSFLYADSSIDFINSSYNNDILGEIPKIEELEGIYIKKALDKYGRTTIGKKNAAKELGIGIATLYRKIKEYDC